MNLICCCLVLSCLLQTIVAQTTSLKPSLTTFTVAVTSNRTVTIEATQSIHRVLESTAVQNMEALTQIVESSAQIQHLSSASMIEISPSMKDLTTATVAISNTSPPPQPTRPPAMLPRSLKFFISGTIINTNYSSDILLRTRLQDIFGESLELVDILSLNSTSGDFDTLLYFNATLVATNTDEEAIYIIIQRKQGYFENLVIKERCYTSTCGDIKNHCTETRNTVLCSCHIGFAGERCSILKVVDGTSYGTWSNWTTCHTCKQRRFRYCIPDPMHGGRCLIGPNPHTEVRLCFKNCERNDSDKDRELVGYVCLFLLLFILLLLVAFCATYKYVKESNNKSSNRSKSSGNLHPGLDAYRVPSILVNSSALQQSKRKRPKNVPPQSPEYAIPMKPITSKSRTKGLNYDSPAPPPERNGFENLGFYHETHDDSEDLYKQQLEIFLNEAPGFSKNGVTTELSQEDNELTIEGNDYGISNTLDNNDIDDDEEEIKDNKSNSYEENNNGENEYDNHTDSDGNEDIVLEIPEDENNKLSFSPALRKQENVQQKIIQGGASDDDKLQLVIT